VDGNRDYSSCDLIRRRDDWPLKPTAKLFLFRIVIVFRSVRRLR
jgi:hypothetical protein